METQRRRKKSLFPQALQMRTDMTWILIAAIFFFSLVGLYLFLIFPSQRRHINRKILDGLYIAHRGLHDAEQGIPENSLLAFKCAIEAGLAIENDIHLTRDGEVVVFHDDDLHRMCGVCGSLEDMTLAELKELNLGNTEEKIPTLRECLDIIDGKVPLLIEYKIKSGSAAPLCEAADKILSEYNGEYFVQSFYPFVLSWYKKNRKDIMRGQLSAAFRGDKLHMRMLGMLLFNCFARPDFISYENETKEAFGRKICTLLGAIPIGWTFKNQKEINESKKDFKGYIFEGFVPSKED